MIKLMIVLLTLSGCSSAKAKKQPDQPAVQQAQEKAKATPPPATSVEAKQLAAEEEAPFVTEVKFAKGKSALTAPAKKKLAALVARAEKSGTVKDIKVVTWADMEYPSVNTKTLPKDQQKLATARFREIKQTLPHDVTVSEYNMARRPGILRQMLDTSDARIKRSLEVSGIPNTDTSVKRPKEAAKSIVMVLLKE